MLFHTFTYFLVISPEFFKKYGTIGPFSQQDFERLNDIIAKDYYRSINHRDELMQIMLKLNHLEKLIDKDCIHEKQQHKYKNSKKLATMFELVPW